MRVHVFRDLRPFIPCHFFNFLSCLGFFFALYSNSDIVIVVVSCRRGVYNQRMDHQCPFSFFLSCVSLTFTLYLTVLPFSFHFFFLPEHSYTV